jgi:transcriptional regulator with XRE-family HTH domain
MSVFSDRLKSLRGPTPQSQFAAELGMKQQQYARYEKGVTVPSVDVLATICRVHACSADWLLGIDRASSSVDERERVGAESRGSGAVMPASGCRDSRQSRSPQVPGELPQCARCPHRKLADKMRKMIGEG